FSRGSEPGVFDFGGAKVGLATCYEAAFDWAVRRARLPAGRRRRRGTLGLRAARRAAPGRTRSGGDAAGR
ncbi:hypothetical protein, partial [Streptomyces sp. NPDC001675]